jgi:thioredoxin 1
MSESENEITITTANFEHEVLQAEVPVLLDFWAPWCGPCRMIAPLLTQLAEAYTGRIKIGKVNADEETALVEKHQVASIPCLLVYHNGSVVKRQAGAVPKQAIEALFKDLLA